MRNLMTVTAVCAGMAAAAAAGPVRLTDAQMDAVYAGATTSSVVQSSQTVSVSRNGETTTRTVITQYVRTGDTVEGERIVIENGQVVQREPVTLADIAQPDASLQHTQLPDLGGITPLDLDALLSIINMAPLPGW